MFAGKEALLSRAALCAAVLLISMGAKHRSTNFIVETADPTLAGQIAEAAERLRGELAVAWLGKKLPNWSSPCPMTVQVGPNLGAGGATSFSFDRGEVFGWRMSIQGSRERVFDCVLPHEITHMIFASHFRQPLPRWADEGGATSVENPAELMKQRRMLTEFLTTNRGIPFNKMFAMRDYPRDVLPLYSQGYSLADFLIQHGGRQKYVNFIADGLNSNDWPGAVKRSYGWKDLGTLQGTWLAWVRQGWPAIPSPDAAAPVMLAATDAAAPGGASGVVPATAIVPITKADPGFVPVGSGTPQPLVLAPQPANNPPKSVYHDAAPAALAATPAVAAIPAVPAVAAIPAPPAPTAPRAPKQMIPVGPPQDAVASGYSLPPLAHATAAGPAAPAWRSPTLSIPAPPADVPTDAQSARPQPYEQPKVTILEWSRE